MSANSIPNKNTAQATNQKIVGAIGQYFAKVKTLTLAGTSYSPSELKSLFQAEIDGNNAVDKAKAQFTELVAETQATRAEAREARKSLRAYILGNYGVKAVSMLQDFGMKPPKAPGPKTVEAKAEAVKSAKATRAEKKARLKGAPVQPANAETQPQGATTDTSSQVPPTPSAESAPKQ